MAGVLRKGDILLVCGSTRFGASIQYLTRSRWSHAALYVGVALGAPAAGEEPRTLVESDGVAGIRAVPLSQFRGSPVRICRAVGLSTAELDRVVADVTGRLGHRYDLRHILDLARYLVRRPPVPDPWKRRMLALGSGDPTRAICSTLIAEAFQRAGYPILPERVPPANDPGAALLDWVLRHRDPKLITPSDFDLSPYFAVVKPRIQPGFDPHRLRWETGPSD